MSGVTIRERMRCLARRDAGVEASAGNFPRRHRLGGNRSHSQTVAFSTKRRQYVVGEGPYYHILEKNRNPSRSKGVGRSQSLAKIRRNRTTKFKGNPCFGGGNTAPGLVWPWELLPKFGCGEAKDTSRESRRARAFARDEARLAGYTGTGAQPPLGEGRRVFSRGEAELTARGSRSPSAPP